jgi:hypothetical protein
MRSRKDKPNLTEIKHKEKYTPQAERNKLTHNNHLGRNKIPQNETSEKNNFSQSECRDIWYDISIPELNTPTSRRSYYHGIIRLRLVKIILLLNSRSEKTILLPFM